MNKRILIVGAASFTAQYLVKQLRLHGDFFIAGSVLSDVSPRPGFDLIIDGDLCDKPSLRRLLNVAMPNIVINLSGISFVGHPRPLDFYEVNVLGVENLLTTLQEVDLCLDAVLLSSSANVYGVPDVGMIDEDMEPMPVNHYAISKLAMEKVALTYLPDLPLIITRPFNYIGFGQSERFVVPKIVKSFALGESQIDLGNVDVSRDFLPVGDVVDAYSKLVLSCSSIGGIYNVCSGCAMSLSEVIDIMGSISGYKIKVNVNSEFVRKNEVPSLCGSSYKLRSIIDWSPTVSLETVLEDMYVKYKTKLY